MGNRGHNGRAGQPPPRSTKARTAADMQRIQEAEEARLQGTPELRAALRPGRLVRLTRDACLTAKMGAFDVLGPGPSPTPADLPRTLRKGALLMMVRIERVEMNGLRRPCYTFLQMGSMRRCTVSDMTLIEPAR